MAIKRLGTMIDCSRNGVMTVDAIKKWADLTSDMGYNTLMLYIEDTYEVDDNPYFGYARGRYTKEELKEIDRYATSKGLEVIPCIQTLAHLNAIVKWKPYWEMVDCNDILLCGEEKVYELVDKMFNTLSECFTTKNVNIGMDEAHMICRGRYYDLHGDCNRTEVLVEHVRRVAETGKKYGFNLTMWSDMFFRLASGGDYYNTDFEVTDEIRALIPDNVELTYWDYYSKDKKKYDKMFAAHEKIKSGTWFAGGLWTWSGFAPLNKFSIETSKAALWACEKNGIENVFFTLWGDDTSECSRFSVISALFWAGQYANGNRSMADIKQKFKEKFGISFDRFMLLDLTSNGERLNTTKNVFYNDLFTGLLDTVIPDDFAEKHKALSRKLALMKGNEEWGYLFDNLKALCDVVSLKADMGQRIRKAYGENDKADMKNIIADIRKLAKLMEKFYICFEKQWMKENKANGFDVQDIRVGGMIHRVKHCGAMLEKWVSGEIKKIDDLETTQLDFFGNGTDYEKHDFTLDTFKRAFTANILTW